VPTVFLNMTVVLNGKSVKSWRCPRNGRRVKNHSKCHCTSWSKTVWEDEWLMQSILVSPETGLKFQKKHSAGGSMESIYKF